MATAELGEAGVPVDLTHMSPQSVRETLERTGELGTPPVVTHGMLSSLTLHEWAFTPEQVVEIYRQGGLFALALSGRP